MPSSTLTILWLNGKSGGLEHDRRDGQVNLVFCSIDDVAQCDAEQTDAVVCDGDSLDAATIACLEDLGRRHPRIVRIVIVDDELVALWQTAGRNVADAVIARHDTAGAIDMIRWMAARAAVAHPRTSPPV